MSDPAGQPSLPDSLHRSLATLAGLLAEHGISRLELTPISREHGRLPARALLPRHTDLPGVIGAELLKGHTADLHVPQLDLTLRVWQESGTLLAGCEPADHPLAAALRSAGII